MAVAAAGVYVWSSRSPRVYQASALVRVFDPQQEGIASGAAQRVDPAREVDIQVLYAESPDVVDEFESRMGAKAERVIDTSVSGVTNADAISISARSRDPQLARTAALTYANAFVNQRRTAIAERFAKQVGALRAQAARLDPQIAELSAQIAEESPADRVVISGGRPVVLPESEIIRQLNEQRAALVSRRTELVNDADALVVDGEDREAAIDLIRSPSVPRRPVSPTPLRDAAVAGLLGLFAGTGLSVLRHRLGDRIATVEDLGAAAGSVAIVASVPSNRSTTGRSPASEIAADGIPRRVAEAYRILRAELLFAAAERSPLTLLVTSARASEGKTSLSANLAHGLASAGGRVVLVDADLRHGRVHEIFDVANTYGLSALRKPSFSLKKAIHRVTLAGVTLDILPAGPHPRDPSELLLSPLTGALFDELRRRYDYVIVDGTPVLPVADALHAARHVDGVVMVAKAHATQSSAFRRARERLAQARTEVLAAVLVAADPERGYDKYYDDDVPRRARSHDRRRSKSSGRDRGKRRDRARTQRDDRPRSSTPPPPLPPRPTPPSSPPAGPPPAPAPETPEALWVPPDEFVPADPDDVTLTVDPSRVTGSQPARPEH